MDPLSITASALALIAASNKIVKTVSSFTKILRTVDARLDGLSNELANLTGFLKAVHKTIEGCRSFEFALVDEDLYHQSQLALSTCQGTLNELALLVDGIRLETKSKNLGSKARLAASLNSRAADIAAFQDKLHKSNWALQTMLHTITVSLSLRNNVSQAMILSGLDQLKASIDQSLRASCPTLGKLSHRIGEQSDYQITRNLRNLARAAQHFHSAATSSASTAHGDASAVSAAGAVGHDQSLFGDFSSSARERVEQYLAESRFHQMQKFPVDGRLSRRTSIQSLCDDLTKEELDSSLDSSSGDVASGLSPLEQEESLEEDDSDDEAEFEEAFLLGLRELIPATIKDGRFSKAIDFIQEALKSQKSDVLKAQDEHQLQTLLAVCHMLQGRFRQAEPIVLKLAESKAGRDSTVCNLLHALALAHLSEYSFEKALTMCRKALRGKKKLHKSGEMPWYDYHQTLNLLVIILDMSGDYVRAEVFRRHLPDNFVCPHPRSAQHFLCQRPSFLSQVLGDSVPDISSVVSELSDWPSTDIDLDSCAGSGDLWPALPDSRYAPGKVSLHCKLSEHERQELDTSKEVAVIAPASPTSGSEADIENEVLQPDPAAIPKRRLTRFFSSRRRRRKHGPKQPLATVNEDCSESDNSPVSPVVAWLKGHDVFRLKNSMTLLKQRPTRGPVSKWKPPPDFDKQTGTFTLLSSSFTSNTKLHTNVTAMQPHSPEGVTRAVEAYKRHKELEEDRAELEDFSPPCELPGSEVDANPAEETQTERRKHRFSRPSRAARPMPTVEEAAEDGEMTYERHINSESDVPTANSEAEDHSTQSKPGSNVRLHNTNVQRCATTLVALPLELQLAVTSLAGVLASLPKINDASRLRLRKRELEKLLPQISHGNDPVLVDDVQRALRRLGDRIKAAETTGHDSGYESLDSPHVSRSEPAKEAHSDATKYLKGKAGAIIRHSPTAQSPLHSPLGSDEEYIGRQEEEQSMMPPKISKIRPKSDDEVIRKTETWVRGARAATIDEEDDDIYIATPIDATTARRKKRRISFGRDFCGPRDASSIAAG